MPIISTSTAQTAINDLNTQLSTANTNIANLQTQLQAAIVVRDAINVQITALTNYVSSFNSLNSHSSIAVTPAVVTPLVQP